MKKTSLEECEYERVYVNKDNTLTIKGLRSLVALGGIKPLSTEEKILIMSDDDYAKEFAKKIGSVIRK